MMKPSGSDNHVSGSNTIDQNSIILIGQHAGL